MMKTTQLILAVAAGALLAGCTSVGVTTVNPAPARPPDCELDIYVDESEVDREFVTACLIDSRTGTTALHRRTAAAAIEHARPKACECGADAVLVQSADTEGVTMATWGRGKAILRAIRYVD